MHYRPECVAKRPVPKVRDLRVNSRREHSRQASKRRLPEPVFTPTARVSLIENHATTLAVRFMPQLPALRQLEP